MRSFNLLCGVASHPPCATALLKAVFLVLNSYLGLWQATFTTANTLVLQNASATALFYGKGTHCASSLPAWHAIFILFALSFSKLTPVNTYPFPGSQPICPLSALWQVICSCNACR